MDDKKNTIVCFSLIGLILFGFYFLNRPSEEQIEAQRRYIDSVRVAQEMAQKELAEVKEAPLFDAADSDSAKLAKSAQKFGVFAQGALGEAQTVTLQNELLSIDFSTKGAVVSNVRLKEYTNYKKDVLTLAKEGDSQFSVALPLENNTVHTSDLIFRVSAQTDSSVTFSLPTENGGSLDFVYTLPANSYMLDFDIKANGLNSALRMSDGTLGAKWSMNIAQQEKGREFENRYSQIYYYSPDEGLDELSETQNDNEEIEYPLRWVAFKDQYFSSVLIADGKISQTALQSSMAQDTSSYLKHFSASFAIPFKDGNSEADFRFFFGPNHYKLLKSYDENLSGDDKLNLKRIVPLGWFIFRWVNQIFTIPMFNLLGGFISNYGIIILIMTLVVKLILFPLTYKSYLSTAKMKVLKPQIDEINARIPQENQAERSQAMMELYSKAGVNPMGGCLPMLLQMPVLVALFYFFPNAIELRGESFLWAEDLSTYDAIISWSKDLWLIGDHISLFCLLMTAANIVYTAYNMSSTDSSQMPMMKYMMYAMPLMFLFIFNDYASGLSYYYFVSLLITIIQTFVIKRFFVDEKKLLQKIHEQQKKPQRSSSWLKRIEEMQKAQQALLEEQNQKRK